jgi:sulfur carrier protein
MQESVVITVNGRERTVARGASVADLLRELGLSAAAVAVERNRRIVRAGDQARAVLEGGDALEVVTLVGGG